ncbi:MAG: T9SS type A sorting domain-containing protein [Bacteroidales bacterium]|nr:T9SS type A sorting domain-containing protein [Bacteroidales bacterium]
MKKILTLLFCWCVTAMVSAQTTIPNAGFEQWNNGAPSSWATAFSFDASIVSIEYNSGERTSDSHTGNYAMKLHPVPLDLTITTYSLPGIGHLGYFNTEVGLTSLLGIFNGGISGIINALIEGGITCNQVPSKVTAWVKYIPASDDEMTVTVRCLREGEVVAEGTYTSHSASGVYQQIEVPVTASVSDAPDMLNIIFSSGSKEGTQLYIDDVELVFETPEDPDGINECNAIFSVAPNPTSEMLNIQSTMNGNYSVSMFDTNGKLVWEGNDFQGNTQIDVSDFDAGIYFVRITNNGLTRTQKVIIR